MISKMDVGFPCSIYIARNINTQQELDIFTHVFVETAFAQGISSADILTMLVVLYQNIPSQTNLNIPSLNTSSTKTALDVCNDLLGLFPTQEVIKCNAFYKKLESKAPACRLCTHSNSYRNKSEKLEYSIIKYMLASKENCLHVLNYADGTFFNCVMDVSIGIPISRISIVPIPKMLFKSLSKPNVQELAYNKLSSSFIGDKSSFDVVWDDSFSTFPRERKVSAALINNPAWGNVLKSTVQDAIESSAVLSESDVVDIFNEYIAGVKTDDIEESSSIFNFISPGIMDPVYTEGAEVNASVTTIEGTKPELSTEKTDSDSKTLFADTDSQTVVDEKPTSIQNVVNPVLDDNTPAADNIGSTPAADATAAAGDVITTINASENDSDYINEEYDETINTEVDHNLHLSDKEYALLSDSNVILHVLLKDSDIKSFIRVTASSDIPEKAYHGILRDKQMPIEVVSYNEEYYFLIYSRHMNRILMCSCSKPSKRVKDLVCRSMIMKICYVPYLIYGVTKLYGYYAKNVFSLNAAQSVLMPSKKLLRYNDLLKSYSTSKPFGYKVSPELLKVCPYAGGMPTYRSMYKIYEGMLNSLPPADILNFYNVNLKNEAVGSSYFYNLNFEDSGCTAILTDTNELVFREEYVKKKKNSGRYVSYSTFEKNIGLPLFEYILIRLSEKGIFRKYNIQLIGLYKQIMTFFIESDSEDYLTSLIDLLIFEHGRDYTISGWKIMCNKYS